MHFIQQSKLALKMQLTYSGFARMQEHVVKNYMLKISFTSSMDHRKCDYSFKTCSSMEAFAQRIPPKNERDCSGLLALIKFLVVFTAIITSSAPSEFISDQPSSLNPLIASLKPL